MDQLRWSGAWLTRWRCRHGSRTPCSRLRDCVPFPHRTLDDHDMARYRAAVDALLRGHEPLPAAVVDRYGAVHRANDAFERLLPA